MCGLWLQEMKERKGKKSLVGGGGPGWLQLQTKLCALAAWLPDLEEGVG